MSDVAEVVRELRADKFVPEEERLRVFTNGNDWVCAHNAKEAMAFWMRCYGYDTNTMFIDEDLEPFEALDDASELTVRDDCGQNPETLTCAQWCEKQGPGFLASQDY